MSYTVTEALCLTEDGRLVPDGHPEGRWFYAPKGAEITDAEAAKYGLGKTEPAAAPDDPPAIPASDPLPPDPGIVVPTKAVEAPKAKKAKPKS